MAPVPRWLIRSDPKRGSYTHATSPGFGHALLSQIVTDVFSIAMHGDVRIVGDDDNLARLLGVAKSTNEQLIDQRVVEVIQTVVRPVGLGPTATRSSDDDAPGALRSVGRVENVVGSVVGESHRALRADDARRVGEWSRNPGQAIALG